MGCTIGWIKTEKGFLLFKSRERSIKNPILSNFIEKGETPILLIDADPDQNLSEMLGIDLNAEQKKTISELLVETFLESGGTTVGVPPSKRIESKIWELGLLEGKLFDFMAIGTKFIEGCYCLPNNALKNALEGLIKSYKYVIIDKIYKSL